VGHHVPPPDTSRVQGMVCLKGESAGLLDCVVKVA